MTRGGDGRRGSEGAYKRQDQSEPPHRTHCRHLSGRRQVASCLEWVVHVDELEPSGPGGSVRFVRRELDVQAFGVNWFELPPGAAGLEHDESQSGQEEIAVVVRGSGVWRVAEVEVPVRVGTFLRFDANQTRCPVAGPDGMTFVAVGARPGSYEPRGPF